MSTFHNQAAASSFCYCHWTLKFEPSLRKTAGLLGVIRLLEITQLFWKITQLFFNYVF